MPYALLNRLTAKPDQRLAVVEILVESASCSRTIRLVSSTWSPNRRTTPNEIWVVDLWTSAEAHAQALKAPELRPWVEKATPLLEGVSEQTEVRPVGGKGMPGT
jgi:quinol monooxygenase YgiN